uniref:TIL domain-containing protein n=1 Tax=Steinernema glaseri TaxID=37863 RepID=A0A1I7ZE10_9BILA
MPSARWFLIALVAVMLFFSSSTEASGRFKEEKLSKGSFFNHGFTSIQFFCLPECPPWCMWSSEFTKCVCNDAKTRCRCVNALGPWGSGWA